MFYDKHKILKSWKRSKVVVIMSIFVFFGVYFLRIKKNE